MEDQPDSRRREPHAAERLARAAGAAQQLCDVLWEALHAELRDPDAERVQEISRRLAEVSATIGLLAQTSLPPPASGRSPGQSGERRTPPSPSVPEPRSAPRANPDLRLATSLGSSPTAEEQTQSEPCAQAAPLPFERPSAPEPSLPFERPSAPEPPQATDGRGAGPDAPVAFHQPIPTRASEYTFSRLVDEHGTTTPVQSVTAPPPDAPEIAIRDVRTEEGPSAWVSSVGRLLRCHAEDGLPFAVLLVEIVDVARLERSSTPHDMHGLVAKVEDALGLGMRAGDHLSRETLGRYWLVAPETNGTGARMLAERLARLVRTSASHRGTPLEVAIGIAVCPDDGTEAPALAARADLGVYAARATGRSVAHSEPPGA